MRPNWLRRLRERQIEARADIRMSWVWARVFLAFACLSQVVSTTVGEDLPSLLPLVETSTACFGAAAITAIGLASSSIFFFLIFSAVYYAVEYVCRVIGLFLALFRGISSSLASLAHVCKLRSLVSFLLLVATAGLGEIIGAFIRYIMGLIGGD